MLLNFGGVEMIVSAIVVLINFYHLFIEVPLRFFEAGLSHSVALVTSNAQIDWHVSPGCGRNAVTTASKARR